MAEPDWIEWSPAHVPHVKGRYRPRTYDPETGLPEPQDFEAECGHVNEHGSRCGGRRVGSCTSGQVRARIQEFAARHVHDDPLAAPRVERPGSLRTGEKDA